MRALTRKESRKAGRQLKKAKKFAFKSKKTLEEAVEAVPGAKRALPPAKRKKPAKKKKVVKEKPTELNEEEMHKQDELASREKRREERDLIRAEDADMKKYAKKLGLHKRRKTQKLPQSFRDDGLEYLLEVCDRNQNATSEGEAQDSDEMFSGSEKDEMDESDEGESDSEENELEMLSDQRASDDDNEEEEEPTELDEGMDQSRENDNILSEPTLTEDIYGRLRDKDGNVVLSSTGHASAAQNETGQKDETQRLTREVRGLVNRISESTLHVALKKLEALYHSRSRNDVKQILTSALLSSFCVAHKLPDRLAMEYTMLIAVIHSNLSTEIVAFFVETLALKFSEKKSSRDIHHDDLSLHNLVVIFGLLYEFKIIKARLIFEIMETLVDSFEQKDIEFLLLLLRNVGFHLRKDDPSMLKSLVESIQSKIAEIESSREQEVDSKVRFMFEALMGVKNNNMLKVGQKVYDEAMLQHMIKVVKGHMKKGSQIEDPLPVGYKDLMDAEKKGRWWIVGSAWVGNSIPGDDPKLNDPSKPSTSDSQPEFSPELMKLAKRYRMNTELRRNIFCVIMSAEDYLDGFEKILKLKLKDRQEREIIHIGFNCCLKEKKFNPYYVLLISKFCQFHNRFQVIFSADLQLTTQYAIWDRLKELENYKPTQSRNLAVAIAELIRMNSIGIAVLKVVNFAELDATVSRQLQLILSRLLGFSSETELKEMFEKLVKSSGEKSRLKLLVDGLRIFMEHVLIKRIASDRVPLGKLDVAKDKVQHNLEYVLNLIIKLQGGYSL